MLCVCLFCKGGRVVMGVCEGQFCVSKIWGKGIYLFWVELGYDACAKGVSLQSWACWVEVFCDHGWMCELFSNLFTEMSQLLGLLSTLSCWKWLASYVLGCGVVLLTYKVGGMTVMHLAWFVFRVVWSVLWVEVFVFNRAGVVCWSL